MAMILVCGCTTSSSPCQLRDQKQTCYTTDIGIVTSKVETPNPTIGMLGGGSHYTVTLNNATYEVDEEAFYRIRVGNHTSLTRCVCK